MKLIVDNNRLKTIALKSNMKFKLAAVIIYRGQVVGEGYNYYNYDIKNITHSLHAEHMAINNALYKVRSLRGASIIVYRHSFSGMALSKPCKQCEKLLRSYGITTAMYSSRKGWRVMKL